MRRAILVPLVVLGVALAATTGVAVVSAVSPPATSGRVVEVEPLEITPGPADGTPAPPAPTPTSTAPVAVTPHGSEDVGDDHGGNSGKGGGDDDNSGSGNSGKGGGSDD